GSVPRSPLTPSRESPFRVFPVPGEKAESPRIFECEFTAGADARPPRSPGLSPAPCPPPLILELSTGPGPLSCTGERSQTGRQLQDQRLPGGGPSLLRRR